MVNENGNDVARAAIGKDDVKILFTCHFKYQGGKGEKAELHMLAITPYRLYIIAHVEGKQPKVDSSFHILEVSSLEGTVALSPTMNDIYLFPLALTTQIGEKQISHRFLFDNEERVCNVVSFILALIRTTFLNANIEKQLSWKLSSSEKQDIVEENINALSKGLSAEDTKACGSFSHAYLCLCDYYKQVSNHSAEVCWDIDKIYSSHKCKAFKLDDFDRLDTKDLVPLMAMLAYNTWFTKLVISSMKLANEIVDVLVKVIRQTQSIEEIVLTECVISKEQLQKISVALAANPNKIIKRINFSKTPIDDKGLSNLCGTFSTLGNGLEMINLSDIGMTSKGAASFVNCLKQNKLMPAKLTELNLSGNPLKLEGVQILCDYFSQPNVLTDLILSNTECPLDLLFTALHRGCQLSLEHLDLSGNSYFGKKVSKDSGLNNSLSSLQQFFSMSRALKSANFSNTKLPATGVKAILVGLLNNPALFDVRLDLSGNELKTQGVEELRSCLAQISLSALNLANNGLEQDLIPLCEAIQANNTIKELDLSQNVNKAKNIEAIADALGDILESETPLTRLFLSDNKLRDHSGHVFDALGTNDTLEFLDIRGNSIGDDGARMLAKALQVNVQLETLLLDRNNITSKGLQDIAQAMERNFSLRSLPILVVDLGHAMKANTSQAFLKYYKSIEKAMNRNQTSQEMTLEQSFKALQDVFTTSVDNYMQEIDEQVVMLEDTISKLKDPDSPQNQQRIQQSLNIIKEAVAFRDVLLNLFPDTEQSKALVDDMFDKVQEDIFRSVDGVIKDNIAKIMKYANTTCPSALDEKALKDVQETLFTSNLHLGSSEICDSIIDLGRNKIMGKLCKSNLKTASNIAGQLKELFVGSLQNARIQLNTVSKSKPEIVLTPTIIEGESENISKPDSHVEQQDDIKENNFRSPLSSLSSDHGEPASLETIKRSLSKDLSMNLRKKKSASLKRRPTFYKESAEPVELHEIDIDVDTGMTPVVENPARISKSLSSDQELRATPPKSQSLDEDIENKVGHSDSIDSNNDRSMSFLSSSSVEDSIDDHSVDAFDEVSKQSVQLNIIKKPKKPGRRKPKHVSNLAHMNTESADVGNSSNAAESSTDSPSDDQPTKQRPLSEIPLSNPMLEEITRSRVSSEKFKREPPARPSPPTPSTKDPNLKFEHHGKQEAPIRPDRPKKPEVEKKPDLPKEKKVKPPTGAFQLPALPGIGSLLKKRPAPKAPDTVDHGKDDLNDTSGKETENEENGKGKEESVALPDDTGNINDTPPTKPPPPVLKHPTSPPSTNDTHSADIKSPEPNGIPESPTNPGLVKKPPRGIPMGGGLGASALMAEMNKKLHITPKGDDEDHSPSKPAAPPPKPQKPSLPHGLQKQGSTPSPQKPAPPQRPPSLKRTGTNSAEGRPNVPDRPKLGNKFGKSQDLSGPSEGDSNESDQKQESEITLDKPDGVDSSENDKNKDPVESYV